MSKLIYGLFFNLERSTTGHVFLNTSEMSIVVLLGFFLNFLNFLNKLSRGCTGAMLVISISLPITCTFSNPLFDLLILLFLTTTFSLLFLFQASLFSGVLSIANKLRFEILNRKAGNVTSAGKVMVVGHKSGKKVSVLSIIISISGTGAGSEGSKCICNGVRSISIGCKVFIGRGSIPSVSFASLKSSISSLLSGSMYVNAGISLV